MPDEQDPIQAVGAGSSQLIGHFHYDIVSDRWEWDDQLYRLHGYEPGEVEVTYDLIMSHKHPDDREKASAIIEEALLHGEPFSAYQRIVTTDGRIRNVVKVGAGIMDERRRVVAMDGFYIDLTSAVILHERQAADDAVTASAEHRASIEQAKGMIMVTYGVDPDAAFAMLRWWSMESNIKVAKLATRLVEAGAVRVGGRLAERLRVDQLLKDIVSSPDS